MYIVHYILSCGIYCVYNSINIYTFIHINNIVLLFEGGIKTKYVTTMEKCFIAASNNITDQLVLRILMLLQHTTWVSCI